MLTALLRRRGRVLLVGALAHRRAARASPSFAFGGSADVVVYNGRSQYGDETAFKQWEDATGKTLELRGGTAPELFERLRSEGDEHARRPARHDRPREPLAREGGRAARSRSTTPTLEAAGAGAVPRPGRRLVGAQPCASARRCARPTCPRTRCTSYEDLGDPRWKGKLCLRTSNNEYNQSLVADMLAKRGPEETRALLESWMANEPQILGSDVDVLEAIAAGRCDVGLTNHYYLARELADDPDFPVAPAWPDQDGAGAHTNLSGVGLVKGSEHARRRDVADRAPHRRPRASARSSPTASSRRTRRSRPPSTSPTGRTSSSTRSTSREAGALLPDAVAADAGRRVEVAAPAPPRRRAPRGLPGWAVVGVARGAARRRAAARPPRLLPHRPGAFGEIADSLLPEALRASAVLARGRRRRDAAARRRRSPRSSPSTTSRAGAGSTGRSCCRSRCPPTCSSSCCSASTTPTAGSRARCATCSACSCPRSARRPARSPC